MRSARPLPERADGTLEVDAEASQPRRRTVRSVQARQVGRPTWVTHTGHISYITWSGTVFHVNAVDHMDPTPLYVQLANLLRGMIESGELAPRAPLPSESYLQQQYGVARGTVRTAVGILRDEGLVVTIGGRGTFVRPAAEQAD